MDDMSQFDRDCIDGENREWEMQQKDKEIERLEKEVEVLNDHYDEADKAIKVALGEQGMEYEKEIEKMKRAFCAIWDCKYESDKIMCFIEDIVGTNIYDFFDEYKKKMYKKVE